MRAKGSVLDSRLVDAEKLVVLFGAKDQVPIILINRRDQLQNLAKFHIVPVFGVDAHETAKIVTHAKGNEIGAQIINNFRIKMVFDRLNDADLQENELLSFPHRLVELFGSTFFQGLPLIFEAFAENFREAALVLQGSLFGFQLFDEGFDGGFREIRGVHCSVGKQ